VVRGFLATLTANSALDRMEGRYAGPNIKPGISVVAVWHITDVEQQVVKIRASEEVTGIPRVKQPIIL
jgi:hypothetical protein